MTQVRQQKELSLEELSTISGMPEDVLQAAESDTIEPGEDLEDVQRIYWALAALEATPSDYRRLLADIAMTATRD
jgi:hypothetical protein